MWKKHRKGILLGGDCAIKPVVRRGAYHKRSLQLLCRIRIDAKSRSILVFG